MKWTFSVSTAMTANQTDVNPIATWAPRFPAFRSIVRIWLNATTTGVRLVLSRGTEAVMPKSQVQGGGTAGVLPSPTSGTSPIEFLVEAGQEIQPLLSEVSGGTPTFNFLMEIEAIG